MSNGENPLEPHLEKKVRLFIQENALHTVVQQLFTNLKFKNITSTNVSGSYTSAMQQLFQLLRKEDDLILIAPPLAVTSGKTTIKKSINDFFHELHHMMEQKNRKNILETISHCVPIFTEAKVAEPREQMLFKLSEFGVSAAFILKQQKQPEEAGAKKQRLAELERYLTEFLTMNREEVLENIKDRLSEEALQKKKQEADGYMARAQSLKKTGNFEEAIHAYKKAIDAYPENVDAYLESGRTYVRIQKYSRALQRFNQATTIAEELPTPNQEIGNMRVKQVQEMVAAGQDPNSAEVKQYMEEAVENFSTSLKKASQLKPLGGEQQGNVAEEMTAKIAGEMFKLNLKDSLGGSNQLAKQIAELASSAINSLSKETAGNKQPAQLIAIGLAAIEMQEFSKAEKSLLLAAEDENHFADACFELNYLGTRLRRNKGEDAALQLYHRILEINPPNAAAIYFNMAVALARLGKQVSSAGYITRAIYTDASMTEQSGFYQSKELHQILKELTKTFEAAEEAADSKKELTNETAHYVKTMDKICEMVVANPQEGMKFLFNVATKNQALFKKPEIYASKQLMTLIDLSCKRLEPIKRPDVQKFVTQLQKMKENEKQIDHTTKSFQAAEQMFLALGCLFANTDKAEAAFYIGQAVTINPALAVADELHGNEALSNLCREVSMSFAGIDRSKLGVKKKA